MNNMPGYPGNIRLSDRGTFLVGMTTTRFRGRIIPPFLDLVGPYPAVKRFITKVETPFPPIMQLCAVDHFYYVYLGLRGACCFQFKGFHEWSLC